MNIYIILSQLQFWRSYVFELSNIVLKCGTPDTALKCGRYIWEMTTISEGYEPSMFIYEQFFKFINKSNMREKGNVVDE